MTFWLCFWSHEGYIWFLLIFSKDGIWLCFILSLAALSMFTFTTSRNLLCGLPLYLLPDRSIFSILGPKYPYPSSENSLPCFVSTPLDLSCPSGVLISNLVSAGHSSSARPPVFLTVPTYLVKPSLSLLLIHLSQRNLINNLHVWFWERFYTRGRSWCNLGTGAGLRSCLAP